MTRKRRVMKIFRLSSGILKIVMSLCIGRPFLASGGRESPVHCELPEAHACGSPNYSPLAFRGFILLRTGFLGGGITSAVPPLALIFSAADLEKWEALTVSFLVNSPLPRIRTPSAGPLASPALARA